MEKSRDGLERLQVQLPLVEDNRMPDGTLFFPSQTRFKYQILGQYLYPLSQIIGKEGRTHYFIDGCAGSGYVLIEGRRYEGSPVIMAKTRAKAKRPSLRCVFIENNKMTFERLKEATEPFSEFCECVFGDFNEEIDRVLDNVSGYFAFILIDPFGFGDPIIKREVVERIMERPNTEILMNYSWEGVSRCAGQLARESYDPTSRSTCTTLDLFHTTKWREVEKKQLSAEDRRRAYLDLYIEGWKRYYEHVEYIEIPPMSKNPEYYLIFTTRHPLGRKIVSEIIGTARRRGSRPLTEMM